MPIWSAHLGRTWCPGTKCYGPHIGCAYGPHVCSPYGAHIISLRGTHLDAHLGSPCGADMVPGDRMLWAPCVQPIWGPYTCLCGAHVTPTWACWQGRPISPRIFFSAFAQRAAIAKNKTKGPPSQMLPR